MSTKVYDWVAYHARQTPDRLAMIDIHSGRRFTYADMQNRTSRLANGLAGEFGVARGDRVAVLANNTTDFLELEFTCLKLGAVYVPLNWRLSVPELEYIVGDAAPGVLVFEDVFEDAAGALLERRKTPALLALNASGAGSPYATLDENAVLRHCSERLARFKQPRSVLFMDELPHNATGKVLKRKLREF